MSHLTKLKAATSRNDLAEILGYKPKSLTAIIYKTPDSLKYTTFEITKKSGEKRTIKAPEPRLKELQSRLSNVLYQCLNEIEQDRDVEPVSFGFRMNRSITENAARHKRRRWVLNIDLENFFPSFNFGRVRGFFIKDRAFSLHPDIATTIAQIACDGTALPQGSPCSPVISELIAQILDMRLVQFSKKFNVTYTRYADDITFSTNQKEFPAAIATPDEINPKIWKLSNALLNKVENSGFKINNNKTRMHFRNSRQTVTGLVVNEKVNIQSSYYRRARAMCDHLFRSGQYFTEMLPIKNAEEDSKPDLTRSLNPLEGILSYIYTVTQHEERRETQEQRQKPRAIRKLYRRFLFYKYFIAPNAPLIVTEGKTDPIYLQEAIKRRTKFHPILGTPDKDAFNHTLRFLNYEGLTHEILDLGGGGTSNLKSIPLDYKHNLHHPPKGRKTIAHRPMEFPVILLLDNDEGLDGIAGPIKKMFNVSFSKKTIFDFYHVTENLYIVKTPEKAETNTCIEDLFPDEWRSFLLKGKKFSSSSEIDPEKEYGKEIFAKSVIRPYADKIDFSKFDILLERICKVIDHYSKIYAVKCKD